LSGQGRNDLEPAALRRYPEIAEHLAWLKKRSAQARMTGSGACVFAEFERREDADALYKQLPTAMRGFVARGLEQHPLHDWAHT
jgi:4-diphosphocytidyl-2-C-methyl-D-erythritol kinase